MPESINPTKDSGTDLTDPRDVGWTLFGYMAFFVLILVSLAGALWVYARGSEAAGVETPVGGGGVQLQGAS